MYDVSSTLKIKTSVGLIRKGYMFFHELPAISCIRMKIICVILRIRLLRENDISIDGSNRYVNLAKLLIEQEIRRDIFYTIGESIRLFSYLTLERVG